MKKGSAGMEEKKQKQELESSSDSTDTMSDFLEK